MRELGSFSELLAVLTAYDRITCQVYVMEICPNRIRGGMVTFQAVWSNIGGIVVAVMMQQLNQKHPDDYLLAMRILWAPVGLMIIFWV